jgi:uncharacterized protein (TIGR02757 family)
VGLVRPYPDPGDQEVVGLVTALLAYGRVASIQNGVRRILGWLGPEPSAAIARGRHRGAGFARGFRYRWTTRRDLIGLLEAIARMRGTDGNLGAGLLRHARARRGFDAGLAAWTAELRATAAGKSPPRRSLRFLLPDPAGAGASKRLHLFLRWMIRPDDGVDLGTWSALFSPSVLTVPLDTHWARMGPRLGFTGRRVAGRLMAREITEALRALDPADPLRFDFPICHLGIRGCCPAALHVRHCQACPLAPVCVTGTRRIARSRAGVGNRARDESGSAAAASGLDSPFSE